MKAHQGNGTKGFAAVTSLLVLVVVGALAVGAFFLSSTNLRLSQNTRSHTVAKYNAELWLDVALMTISDGYVALGRMPTLAELEPFLIASDEYEITRYSVDTVGDGGEIQVTGLALRGDSGAAVSRHPVSARFTGVLGGGGSAFGPGFVTPQDINVSGASVLSLNMHAGSSLNVSGNVEIGEPALGGSYSFKSGTGSCSLGTAGACADGQDPPGVQPVDWQAEYDAAMAEYCPAGPAYPIPNGNQTRTIHVPDTSASAGIVICLPASGRFEITGGPLRDAVIVGGMDTIVTLRAGSALNPTSPNDPADFGLRMIAGDIYLTSGNTLSDRNLVVAYGNVILDRAVTRTEVEEVDIEGVTRRLTVVKTSIQAGNNVVFSGSGGSGTYAQVIANGKFCRNGNGGAKFVGTIIAGASEHPNGTNLGNNDDCGSNRAYIDFRGGGGWTASLPDRFDVPDPTPPAPSGIVVTSRRP